MKLTITNDDGSVVNYIPDFVPVKKTGEIVGTVDGMTQGEVTIEPVVAVEAPVEAEVPVVEEVPAEIVTEAPVGSATQSPDVIGTPVAGSWSA